MIGLSIGTTKIPDGTAFKKVNQVILKDIHYSILKGVRAMESPMRSAARGIEKILQSHLGVTANGHEGVGVATGKLRARLKVVPRTLKVPNTLLTQSNFYDVNMAYDVDFSNGVEYGIPIGEDTGYKFEASVNQIATWIMRKGKSKFYVKDKAGNRNPVTNRKEAKRAAGAIIRKTRNSPNIVLPDWYYVNDSDNLQPVEDAVRRTSNLFASEFVKQMQARPKKTIKV